MTCTSPSHSVSKRTLSNGLLVTATKPYVDEGVTRYIHSPLDTFARLFTHVHMSAVLLRLPTNASVVLSRAWSHSRLSVSCSTCFGRNCRLPPRSRRSRQSGC